MLDNCSLCVCVCRSKWKPADNNHVTEGGRWAALWNSLLGGSLPLHIFWVNINQLCIRASQRRQLGLCFAPAWSVESPYLSQSSVPSTEPASPSAPRRVVFSEQQPFFLLVVLMVQSQKFEGISSTFVLECTYNWLIQLFFLID